MFIIIAFLNAKCVLFISHYSRVYFAKNKYLYRLCYKKTYTYERERESKVIKVNTCLHYNNAYDIFY